MKAEQGSNRLESTQKTTALYRACMGLSEEARSLGIQNEGMKRLGLNAQILAAQTGTEGSALEVIVAEIGRLSRGIRECLGGLSDASRILSDASIGLLHLSHLASSLEQGAKIGIDPSSLKLYDARLEEVRTKRHRHLADLGLRLDEVSSQISDLARIAVKIPPVVTMIRIVVTEIRLRSEELTGTIDDLKTFHLLLDTKIETMSGIRRDGSRLIEELSTQGTR
ncbi:MAG: hypothetical protein IPK50_17160 [Fibrobacterota bacterium]|nr:hypothetical protein [Fibrobacterota bacterium]QQS04006.1 MAG: hypothetical protein IPK50_17160 [Fibrobacterota bacterium]